MDEMTARREEEGPTKRAQLGELLPPIAGSAVAAWMLFSQMQGDYWPSVVRYTAFLAAPIFLFSAWLIVTRGLALDWRSAASMPDFAARKLGVWALLAGVCAAIVCFEWIGYAPSLFLFSVIAFRALGAPSLVRAFISAAILTGFVAVAFEHWLKLPLPHGELMSQLPF